jgi:hypothetical protein
MSKTTQRRSRDDRGKALHDRATRGLSLTPDEQRVLDEWYADRDAQEEASIGRVGTRPDLDAVREQVDEAMSRVLIAGQRLQELITETDRLRSEIANLEQRLATAATPK